jgi:hypothetical protein
MLETKEQQIAYVKSGDPFRTSDGKVYQNGSRLSAHNGYWWWDVGCPIAPLGQEVNLPLIDLTDDEIKLYV